MDWVRKYLGTPWELGAVGPAKFDCWGLLRDVYRLQLGIDLPAHQIELDSIGSAYGEFVKATNSGTLWAETQQPRHLDAVALGVGRKVHHVGVFLAVDGGLVLHCAKPVTVATPLNRLPLLGYRLIKFYRHADRTRNNEPF